MINATEARAVSNRSKAQIASTRARNAAAKRQADAKQHAEERASWAVEIRKDYDTKLAAALQKGNRSFKQDINTLYDEADLSITAFLNQEEDAPVHRSVWRSLRARGYKVEISKKSEFHPEIEACASDEMPGREAYHSYTYTAKVSW